jgi:DNA-binding response OmpR family regulator
MPTKRKKAKILMIEDDVFLMKIYRNKLTRKGFKFIGASTGDEGPNKAISGNPDLILLDLVLPGKNGFDVLEEIKKHSKTKDIPVIILSALGEESDIQKGLALGAEDYLVKSDFLISETVNKIKKWLPESKRTKGGARKESKK